MAWGSTAGAARVRAAKQRTKRVLINIIALAVAQCTERVQGIW
jgi:hypothetical protein